MIAARQFNRHNTFDEKTVPSHVLVCRTDGRITIVRQHSNYNSAGNRVESDNNFDAYVYRSA